MNGKKEQFQHSLKRGIKMTSNYRPLSCMQMLRKERIMNFMKNEKLFSNLQYGFILGESTQLEYIRQMD